MNQIKIQDIGKDAAMEQNHPYLPEGALTLPHLIPCTDTACAITENRFFTGSLRGLEAACSQGRIVEGTAVLCDCQTMSLTVDFGSGIRGRIPREEVCYQPDGGSVKDIAIITRVGKPVQCRVLGFGRGEGGEVFVRLSRREAQKECHLRYLSHLRPGDIIPARITHMEPFGAFMDIGCGMVSLATVDCLSVSRISHPRDRFSAGECILAVVRQNDPDTGRIYMSTRELLGTWEENAAGFTPAQTVTGIVRSTEEYGVFVELTPNLAGLAEPRDDCQPGDGCAVYIKSILPERMKIKLVMIDLCDPPQRSDVRYYLPENSRHMDRWQYSPHRCERVIETVFADMELQLQS